MPHGLELLAGVCDELGIRNPGSILVMFRILCLPTAFSVAVNNCVDEYNVHTIDISYIDSTRRPKNERAESVIM